MNTYFHTLEDPLMMSWSCLMHISFFNLTIFHLSNEPYMRHLLSKQEKIYETLRSHNKRSDRFIYKDKETTWKLECRIYWNETERRRGTITRKVKWLLTILILIPILLEASSKVTRCPSTYQSYSEQNIS